MWSIWTRRSSSLAFEKHGPKSHEFASSVNELVLLRQGITVYTP